MKENEIETEENNGQEEQKESSKKEESKKESKAAEPNIVDALMDNPGIKKLFSGLSGILLGAVGGFGVSHYFSSKREEKAKKENETLKQSLTEMLEEFKKLKKKQKKAKKKQEAEEKERETTIFSLNGTSKSDETYEQYKKRAVRNAHLD